MARNVLASEIISRGREAADAVSDTNITDVWLYKTATAGVAKLWDLILMHGLGGEGIKTVFLKTVSGQTNYDVNGTVWALTSGGAYNTALTDFYKVKTLYCDDGNSLYRPISRVTPNEEYGQKAPAAVLTLKLCYIPCAPVWTIGSETFDGINGWEEWLVQYIAYAIKMKQQDDGGPHKGAQREVEEAIKVMANRNADEPPRVIRRRASRAWAARTLPYTGGVGGWDLRANNIELYAPSFGLFL